MSQQKCIHVLVYGLVQGVFFRRSTVEQAEVRELCGWVRNRSGGQVEVLAVGDERNLLALLAWLGKGPERARVTKVDIQWISIEAVEWPEESSSESFALIATL